jgi:hypothetical protein
VNTDAVRDPVSHADPDRWLRALEEWIVFLRTGSRDAVHQLAMLRPSSR